MEGSRDAGAAGYSLALSEQELRRYRMMAAIAADNEAAEWAAAGIVPGARVADVGCGPGAVLRMLAERVGVTQRRTDSPSCGTPSAESVLEKTVSRDAF